MSAAPLREETRGEALSRTAVARMSVVPLDDADDNPMDEGSGVVRVPEYPAPLSEKHIPTTPIMLAGNAKESMDEEDRVIEDTETEHGQTFHALSGKFSGNKSDIDEQDFALYLYQIEWRSSVRAMLICWTAFVVYLIVEFSTAVGNEQDAEKSHNSYIQAVLTLPAVVPVPVLILISMKESLKKHMQLIFSVVGHCFAFSFMACGFHNLSIEWVQYINVDVQRLVEHNADMQGNESLVYNSTATPTWWKHKHLVDAGNQNPMADYLRQIVVPVFLLNIDAVVPLVVLILAPELSIGFLHYVSIAFISNLVYSIVVSISYPQSGADHLLKNKFIIVLGLYFLTGMLLWKHRRRERLQRLVFSSLEKPKQDSGPLVPHQERRKTIILLDRDRPMDVAIRIDSPLNQALSDLKEIQRTQGLPVGVKKKVHSIITTLATEASLLYNPDLDAEFKRHSKMLIDGDVKTWARSSLSKAAHPTSFAYSASTAEECSIMEDSLLPEVEKEFHSSLVNFVENSLAADLCNVDVLQLSSVCREQPLIYVTIGALKHARIFDLCGVSLNACINFFFAVEAGYLHNIYHSRYHAADVVCTVRYMVAEMDNSRFNDFIAPLEYFGLVISAAIVDFKHPGTSNLYLSRRASDLAITYSDIAILEQLHLAEAFSLMRKEKHDILKSMKPIAQSKTRKLIVDLVLATDIAAHMEIVNTFKAVHISKTHGNILDNSRLMMKMMIKSADLSIAFKDVQLHIKWVKLLIEEFFAQGDLEREARVHPLSPFCDRTRQKSAIHIVSLFEFVYLPYFEVLSEVYQSKGFDSLLEKCQSNYVLWKEAEVLDLQEMDPIIEKIFQPAIDGKQGLNMPVKPPIVSSMF